MQFKHICQTDGAFLCLDVLIPESDEDLGRLADEFNKCDECCRVKTCDVCGPCNVHDPILELAGIEVTI